MSEIKNFPHQYNDLRKLRATVDVYAELRSEGRDVGDDGVLGYELARRQIYSFRGLDYDAPEEEVQRRLEERIGEEQLKASSTQGARTAAREMRRTLVELGWIYEDAGPLTEQGRALRETEPGSREELALVRESLMRIRAEDQDGRVSHPVRILLRLVGEHEFRSRSGMELALVAKDDSVSEYERVSSMAELSHDERKEMLGATDHQMANAVKILPSFALQAGLMAEDASGRYHITSEGAALLKSVGVSVPVNVEADAGTSREPYEGPPRARRPAAVDPSEVGAPRSWGGDRSPMSPEDQREAARLLVERDDRHQRLVRMTAQHAGTCRVYEDVYDLLFEPSDPQLPLILWEIKTLDGDANSQVRRVTEQLPWYEYWNVRPEWADRDALRAALFEEELPEHLSEYLETAHGIAAFTIDEDGGLVPLNESARGVLGVLNRT